MPGMVAHGEFLGDDLGDQRRSPHPGVQTMSHRAAVQNIPQLFPLAGTQLGGASRAMALQQTFIAIVIPRSDPSVNAGAVHEQALGNLPRGLLLDAEHDGLKSQRHAGCFVGLGFLAKRLKPLEGS